MQLKEISKAYNAVDPDQRDDWMRGKIEAVSKRAIVNFGLAKYYCTVTNSLTVFKHAKMLAKWNELRVSDREVELTALRKKRQNEYVLSTPQFPVL